MEAKQWLSKTPVCLSVCLCKYKGVARPQYVAVGLSFSSSSSFSYIYFLRHLFP